MIEQGFCTIVLNLLQNQPGSFLFCSQSGHDMHEKALIERRIDIDSTEGIHRRNKDMRLRTSFLY